MVVRIGVFITMASTQAVNAVLNRCTPTQISALLTSTVPARALADAVIVGDGPRDLIAEYVDDDTILQLLSETA